jgi:tetratricopeptide (TPR) repeat protein
LDKSLPEKSVQKPFHSSEIWIIVGIFCLAMVVRFFYLYQSSANPTFNAPIVDAQGYDYRANELIGSKGLTEDFFYQQILYPFFLAAIYFVSGSSILFAKIIQSLFGGLTCVLTYYLGARILDRRAGILAAVFTALYGPLIFHEAELVTEGFATLWSAALILLVLKIKELKNLWVYFLAGVCGILAVLTRPNFLPIVTAFAVWLVVLLYRSGIRWQKTLAVCGTLLAGFAAVAVPVALLSHHVTGHFAILPPTGGINAYIGNNPDFAAGTVRPGISWERINDLAVRGSTSRDAWDKQRFFYAKTKEYILTRPWSFLKGLAYKTVQFFSSREMPGNVDVYIFTQWSPLLNILLWKQDGFGFPFGVLLPLALIGLVIFRRRTPVPILIFLVIYPITVIWAHVESRYRVPMIPVLAVYAAAGCLAMYDMMWQGRWKRAFIFTCCICFVAFLSSIAGPFDEEKFNYKAEMYLGVATYNEMHGKTDEAISNYQKALALNPTYSEAYSGLAKNLYQKGQFDKAAEDYRAALKFDPNNYIAHCGLGAALFRQGKFDDALAQFNEALRIKPDYALAHINLALEFERQGRDDEALNQFNDALRIDPSDALAQEKTGMILARQGKVPEAINHFQNALKLNPDLPKVREALGVALVISGRPAEAMAQFHKALELQPANADAHFYIGICLKEQNQLTEAAEEFRQTLLIDPNYTKAKEALNALSVKE